MTTSTPPAWNFLHEHDVPDPTYRGCLPSEQYPSDGDQCPECRCAPNTPHATGCGWPAHLAECDNLDDGEPLIRVTEPPKCPVCLHEMENDEGIICDHCGEPMGVESFAVTKGPGGVFVYHLPCYDEVYWGFGDADDVKVMDTNVDKWSISGDNKGFDVPFKVQEFMFEELCEEKIAELPHLIFTHSERIIEMARDRFRKGYAKYGSEMYNWSPERRLDETLQEIADSVVYPTSGPIE